MRKRHATFCGTNFPRARAITRGSRYEGLGREGRDRKISQPGKKSEGAESTEEVINKMDVRATRSLWMRRCSVGGATATHRGLTTQHQGGFFFLCHRNKRNPLSIFPPSKASHTVTETTPSMKFRHTEKSTTQNTAPPHSPLNEH